MSKKLCLVFRNGKFRYNNGNAFGKYCKGCRDTTSRPVGDGGGVMDGGVMGDGVMGGAVMGGAVMGGAVMGGAVMDGEIIVDNVTEPYISGMYGLKFQY